MQQRFLTKNIKFVEFKPTSQKDIEYTLDLCLILSKLVAIRFDSYAAHLLKLNIYPRLDLYASCDLTYEYL